MKSHYEITVKGRVQGVGYRFFVKSKAAELKLKGYARNSYDGNVIIEAEGEKTDLDTFVDYLWLGPPLARVSRVDIAPAPYTNQYDDFIIKF